MRMLIAGAGGFVGGALVERLAAHELILPSREPEKFRSLGVKSAFPVFNEDLENLVIESAPEVVINLLGIIHETPGSSFKLVLGLPRKFFGGNK